MRLIDADAYLKKVCTYNKTGCGSCDLQTKCPNDEPTIDVVPVIRCKDCKYFIDSNEQCQLIDTRLHFYERYKRWTEDSFCSWAERKEKDGK